MIFTTDLLERKVKNTILLKMKKSKIKSFWNEEWKDLELENLSERSKYKISNYGRMVSYYYHDEGYLLKLSSVKGYSVFRCKDKYGTQLGFYMHRLVAQHFLPEPREDQNQVIHLDNIKHNNYFENLQWASEKEKRAHQDKMNPGWSLKGNLGKRKYSKLTESQVKLIKRKINDPNRKTRMKIIARRYGISEMQLYRIKSGENWGSVSPD